MKFKLLFATSVAIATSIFCPVHSSVMSTVQNLHDGKINISTEELKKDDSWYSSNPERVELLCAALIWAAQMHNKVNFWLAYRQLSKKEDDFSPAEQRRLQTEIRTNPSLWHAVHSIGLFEVAEWLSTKTVAPKLSPDVIHEIEKIINESPSTQLDHSSWLGDILIAHLSNVSVAEKELLHMRKEKVEDLLSKNEWFPLGQHTALMCTQEAGAPLWLRESICVRVAKEAARGAKVDKMSHAALVFIERMRASLTTRGSKIIEIRRAFENFGFLLAKAARTQAHHDFAHWLLHAAITSVQTSRLHKEVFSAVINKKKGFLLAIASLKSCEEAQSVIDLIEPKKVSPGVFSEAFILAQKVGNAEILDALLAKALLMIPDREMGQTFFDAYCAGTNSFVPGGHVCAVLNTKRADFTNMALLHTIRLKDEEGFQALLFGKQFMPDEKTIHAVLRDGTPLMKYAFCRTIIQNNMLTQLKHICEAGIDLTLIVDTTGNTLLHEAVKNTNTTFAKKAITLLIDAGIPPHSTNKKGERPLAHAQQDTSITALLTTKKEPLDNFFGLDTQISTLQEILGGIVAGPITDDTINAVILAGPPGTGKTEVAKALADTYNCDFYEYSPSQTHVMFIGGHSRDLLAALETVTKRARGTRSKPGRPCIFFFDEIDSLGGINRDPCSGINSTVKENNIEYLNLFLQHFSKIKRKKLPILFVGATNNATSLDSAFTRRFKMIPFGLPNEAARHSLLTHLFRQLPRCALSADVTGEIARKTAGFSPAQITEIKKTMLLKAGTHPVTDEIAVSAYDESVRLAQDEFAKMGITFITPRLVLDRPFIASAAGSGAGGSSSAVAEDQLLLADSDEPDDTHTPDTFDSLKGVARETLMEMRGLVSYLKDSTYRDALGAPAQCRVLLFGPPGTGKTTLGKMVAQEAHVGFMYVSGGNMVADPVRGQKALSLMFERAKAMGKAIVFIDEGEIVMQEPDRFGFCKQIQTALSGFTDSSGLMVMVATNFPERIASAMTERLPKQIFVPLPDEKGRRHILRHYLRQYKGKAATITPAMVAGLAQKTAGCSGRTLQDLVKNAVSTMGQEAAEAGTPRSEVCLEERHLQASFKSMQTLVSRRRTGISIFDAHPVDLGSVHELAAGLQRQLKLVIQQRKDPDSFAASGVSVPPGIMLHNFTPPLAESIVHGLCTATGMRYAVVAPTLDAVEQACAGGLPDDVVALVKNADVLMDSVDPKSGENLMGKLLATGAIVIGISAAPPQLVPTSIAHMISSFTPAEPSLKDKQLFLEAALRKRPLDTADSFADFATCVTTLVALAEKLSCAEIENAINSAAQDMLTDDENTLSFERVRIYLEEYQKGRSIRA